MEQGAMHRQPAQTPAPAGPYRLGAGPDDDFIDFVGELEDDDPAVATDGPWRVLIADDDRSVHEATLAALAGLRIHDRPLSFLHAYSAREALSLLSASDPVHLVLLDVVMESPDAGLRAVNDIRHRLGLNDLKIVIRTGQPGLASETDIRDRYAIDGYANKAEMTRSMLCEVIAAALRPGSASPGTAH